MADIVECSICLEFYSAQPEDSFVTTPCGHTFHKSCLDPFFGADERLGCPYCRRDGIQREQLITMHNMPSIFCDKKFQIVVIGDSAVGKTCLSQRFCDGTFAATESTVGIEYWTRGFEVGRETVKLHIWDTAGQELFRAITPQYIRGSQGIIIAYELGCVGSFQSIGTWIDFANNYNPEAIKIVVGTKSDLRACSRHTTQCSVVTEAQKQELMERHGLLHFETSAKEHLNVEVGFRSLIGLVLQNRRLVRQAYEQYRRRENHGGDGHAALAVYSQNGQAQAAAAAVSQLNPPPTRAGCC